MSEESSRDVILTNVEKLFHAVKRYRKSREFWEIMYMCAKFRHLAPFNSMLVYTQRPGARYVMTESDWMDKYQRSLKPNARPLVILVPFGPVDFVYDISDTQPNGDLYKQSDQEILDIIAAPYKTRGEVNMSQMHMLIDACAYHSIALDLDMDVGSEIGGQINFNKAAYKDKDVQLRINKELTATYPAYYLVSVSKKAEQGERFASILHEVAHLLCCHLSAPREWKDWKVRHPSKEAREFEAESASWLICEHLNIGNPSHKYLANYLNEYDEVPYDFSFDRVCNAYNTLIKMVKPDLRFTYKDGLVYKYDKNFQDTVKDLFAEEKRRQQRARNRAANSRRRGSRYQQLTLDGWE